MKITILLLFCSIFNKGAFACINEYRTLLTGEVRYTDAARGKVWPKQIDRTELMFEADTLLSNYKRTGSIKNYSDYGATLTYLGEYQKAKKVYQEIEALRPDSYTTASNLGTIYELIGKPDSALIWIKKSIRLNPNSHRGSEWIHVKILEFKISGSNDFHKSILGLNFGKEGLPSNPKNYDLSKLEDHIWHQLSERTVFVKPKNKIVGQIYFDLGNVLAQTTDVQAALQSYEAAKEYGYSSERLDLRIKEMEELALLAKPYHYKEKAKHFIRRNLTLLFLLGLGSLLAVIVFMIRIRRKKRK